MEWINDSCETNAIAGNGENDVAPMCAGSGWSYSSLRCLGIFMRFIVWSVFQLKINKAIQNPEMRKEKRYSRGF